MRPEDNNILLLSWLLKKRYSYFGFFTLTFILFLMVKYSFIFLLLIIPVVMFEGFLEAMLRDMIIKRGN